MNVTVEEQDKLRRKLAVEVPLDEVRSAYDAVYQKLRSGGVRVNGFRPGKFPRQLADKRFKNLMAGEAMQTLVPRYFEQAVKELELRPATEPQFDKMDIDQRRPFRFEVEFEVIPTFEMLPASAFTLEETPLKVSAKEVDARVEELRKSRATFEDKGDVAAEAEDQVTFDFEGLLDGVPFDGGSGEGQRIELGSGQYLPEFDTAFQGIKAGESRTFPLTFPEDYGEASLAGKVVQFSVQAKTVERKVPPELGPEFFAQFGTADNLKDFKEELKQELLNEGEHRREQERQNALAEQIRERFDFDVPEILVAEHMHAYAHQLGHDDPELLADEKRLAEARQAEEDSMRGNLRLAYVVDALSREHGIEADEQEISQRFFMQCYMMRQNPKEVMNTPFGARMRMQVEQNIVTAKTLSHLAKLVLEAGTGADATKKVSKAKGGAAADKADKAKADKAEAKPKKAAAAKGKAAAAEKDGGKGGAKKAAKPAKAKAADK